MSELNPKIGQPPSKLKLIIVNKVVDFVYNLLPLWRDDLERDKKVKAEELLNEQLCTFLCTEAVNEEVFYFHHEQHQTAQRRVDMAAKPTKHLISAGIYGSKYDVIATFEAKRLPAPSLSRRREYVIGESKASGGIQRYKLCLHGASLSISGIIGYIQKNDFSYFYNTINAYIDELVLSKCEPEWSSKEKLLHLTCNTANNTARTLSKHSRIDGTMITLHHLWVDMQKSY